MNLEQIKTGDNNITIISDAVIESIPKIKVTKSQEINDLIYNCHKELLRIAKNKNKSWEVAMFIDLLNPNNKYIIKGTINGVDMHVSEEVMHLINYNPVASVIVLHNHPRNGLFSEQDLNTFCDYNSIYLITAVCNDGNIHMLRKEKNFNPFALERYYNEGAMVSEKRALEEIYRKAKKLKLDFNKKEDKEKIAKIKTKPYYYGMKNVAKHAADIGLTYRCSVKRKGGV